MEAMQVLYQRRCAKYIYVVPEGLRELMTDISREVIRHHPEHIYTFIADYLDALLITRENARAAAGVVENLTEAGQIIAELLQRTNITRDGADRAAKVIQRAFRRHMTKRAALAIPLDEQEILDKIMRRSNLTCTQANEAAIIIQRAYRRYRIRKLRADEITYPGKIDWREAARNTIGLYRHLNVTWEELHRAATLIKAAYKGYYTRKMMRRFLELQKVPKSEVDVYIAEEEEEDAMYYTDDDLTHMVIERAAIIIQRAFRKYIRVRHLEISKKSLDTPFYQGGDILELFKEKAQPELYEDIDLLASIQSDEDLESHSVSPKKYTKIAASTAGQTGTDDESLPSSTELNQALTSEMFTEHEFDG